MKELDIKNIMKLREVYETDYNLYLILEFLNGGSLYDLIKLNKNFVKRDSINNERHTFWRGSYE